MSGKGTLGEKAAAVVSGIPCDSCPSSDLCTEECATFMEYVRQHSPEKREDNLVDFEVSVARVPGARKIAERNQDNYTGYKRDTGSKSQQGWDNVLTYGDSDYV